MTLILGKLTKLRKIDSNFIFPKGERIDIELLFEWENNL